MSPFINDWQGNYYLENWRSYQEHFEKVLPARGKSPLVTWDSEPSEELASKYPTANLWALLGASRAIIDPDSPEAESFVQFLNLPICPTAKSGRRSLHRYFRITGKSLEPLTAKIGGKEDLELKTGRMGVILPPSVHPDTGQQYEWLDGLSPFEIGFPELPPEVYEAIKEKEVSRRPVKMESPWKEPKKNGRLDAAAYLNHYGWPFHLMHRNGLDIYLLERCPWGEEHSDDDGEGDGAIIQAPDGTLGYSCYHVHCRGRGWQDIRTLISGQDKLGIFYQGNDRASALEGGRPSSPPESVMQTDEGGLGGGSATGSATAKRAKSVTLVAPVSVVSLSRNDEENPELTRTILCWVNTTDLAVSPREAFEELRAQTGCDQAGTFRMILSRLYQRGKIQKVGYGRYRRLETEYRSLDFRNAPAKFYDLALPLEVDNLARITPKSVAIVAGFKDSGKTAFCLDTARRNMTRHKVIYWSSEGGAEELKIRLEKFKGLSLDDWQIEAREKTKYFADAMESDALHIIDYLEITENAFLVADRIAEIIDQLRDGIAIIALQKVRGRDYGRGDTYSAEKSRLYLALDPGKIKIVHAKFPAGLRAAAGRERSFRLIDGCEFVPTSNWVKGK